MGRGTRKVGGGNTHLHGLVSLEAGDRDRVRIDQTVAAQIKLGEARKSGELERDGAGERIRAPAALVARHRAEADNGERAQQADLCRKRSREARATGEQRAAATRGRGPLHDSEVESLQCA